MINQLEFSQPKAAEETSPGKPKSPEFGDRKLSLSELAELITAYNKTRREIKETELNGKNLAKEDEPSVDLKEFLSKYPKRYDGWQEKLKSLEANKKDLFNALSANADILLKMVDAGHLRERLCASADNQPLEKLEEMTDEEIRQAFKKKFLGKDKPLFNKLAIDYLLDIH